MPMAQVKKQNKQNPKQEKQEPVAIQKERGRVDIYLLAIVSVLIILGMLMLFSASYPKALSENQDSYYLIRRQAIFLVVGIVAAFVIARIDYNIWRKLAWPLMLFALISLVVVLTMRDLNNAHRWIFIETPIGTITYQPSELAKIAIILVFALMLAGHQHRLNQIKYGLAPFAVLLVTVAALVIIEPHVSGTILIVGVGFAMMCAGGVPVRYLVLFAGAGLLFAWLVWTIRPTFLEHAFIRIETFRDFDNADPDAARQSLQSMTAIGSGGLFGKGLGKSRQKYMYLPEMHNDYIFAILCEEFGFVGAMVTIVLYFALLVRCLMISRKVKDTFGSMLVVGIAAQIMLQALLHMAVNANAIPGTGISLPFFSYGGTALMLQLGEIGIVLSVSRRADLDSRKQEQEEREQNERRLAAAVAQREQE